MDLRKAVVSPAFTAGIIIFGFIIIIPLALGSGRYALDIPLLVRSVFQNTPDLSGTPWIVLWNIRLPRVIVSMGVGACLALAGMIYQLVFRNTLADGSTVGVSSGAAFGAAAFMILWPGILSANTGAFLFALFAMSMTMMIAKQSSGLEPVKLVLGGIIVGALFTGGLSYLKTLANNEQIKDLMFWLMGGLYGVQWKDVLLVSLSAILGTAILFAFGPKIDLLSMGDSEAKSMGLPSTHTRFLLLTLATYLVAVSISVSGMVSWVGLIVPNILRLIVGSSARRLTLLTSAGGAFLVLVSDTLARTLSSGEIPLSFIITLMATPFLFVFMHQFRPGVKND